MTRTGGKLRAWVFLSRPPFHTVGLLPYILGIMVARHQKGIFRPDVFAWGTLGVSLIMLATYYAGEYWDFAEDSLADRFGSSRFSGGSQVVQRGLLPRSAALWASIASVFSALCVGSILQWGYPTGPWTLSFGVIGIVGGFFYSARPIRWVTRGWGELWIAFCYGWLPVAVGSYLQVAEIPSLIHWLSVPIGLTIFNVILLNEFPDYDADSTAGKANLVVRIGRVRASCVYALASTGSWVVMMISLVQNASVWALGLYAPILVLSVVLVVLVLRGRWQDKAALERLCGANLIVNLGTTAAYILTFAG